MRDRSNRRSFAADTRGVAATEFAFLAPILIAMFLGIVELGMRYRVAEETSRYVHQIADMVSREEGLTSDNITDLHNAAEVMMQPVGDLDNLHLEIASIGFDDDTDATPFVLWTRAIGESLVIPLEDAEGLGTADESVIRVAVRYNYQSPLGLMFNDIMSVEKVAYLRPRLVRQVKIDGQKSEVLTISAVDQVRNRSAVGNVFTAIGSRDFG